jgi:FkbM family methyltransferase
LIKILCIYSFEPNNPKIKIYDKAVFNTSKNQNLFFSNKLINIRNMSLSEISSREKKVNISLNKFIKVQCLCIDELINKFNFVDLIKIDIEGQEYSITLSLYNKKYQ